MLIERWSTASLLAPVLLAIGLACSATTETETPELGTAFGEMRASTAGFDITPRFAPGQELILMFITLRNETDEPLTITRIEALEAGSEEAADVVRFAIGPKADGFPGGAYASYPPGLDMGGTRAGGPQCIYQSLREASGFTMPPFSDEPTSYFVAVHVRFGSPGTWRLEEQRIFYEQGGRRLYQDIPFTAIIPIEEGVGQELPGDIRPCVTTKTLLPGWQR